MPRDAQASGEGTGGAMSLDVALTIAILLVGAVVSGVLAVVPLAHHLRAKERGEA